MPAGTKTASSADHLTLTRSQERLVRASELIRHAPPGRIDFLHTIQCQCGIPYRNPGDEVREWDRKQGEAILRVEAGSALDPRTGQFVKLGAYSPGQRGRPQRLGRSRRRGVNDRLRSLSGR